MLGKKELGTISSDENAQLIRLQSNAELQQADHKRYLSTLVSNFPAIVQWCLRHNVKVINLSATLDFVDSAFLNPIKAAIQTAIQNGITFVGSAGNYMAPWSLERQDWYNPYAQTMRYDQIMYPAAYEDVLSAGSYFKQPDDMNLQEYKKGLELGFPPPWDNVPVRTSTMYGQSLDFVMNISGVPMVLRNTDRTYSYSVVRGASSNAAPQLSAIAALVLSRYPNISPQDLKKILVAAASNAGKHELTSGYGRIDLQKALGFYSSAGAL